MNKYLLFIFCSLLLHFTKAQPSTDIYILDMEVKENSIRLYNPKNITDRDGYDNQPHFINNGKKLLYTSVVSGNQSDIFGYDIKKGKTERITNTPVSEYSPIVMPDGKNFSSVVVEKDSTQRLWKYPVKGGESELVLEKVRFIGYHSWIDKYRLALFVIGQPITLQIASTLTGNLIYGAENIGRSIHKIPGKNLISFVHKEKRNQWVIKSLNPDNLEVKTIIETLPNSEDLCWMSDGTLLMGDGKVLYKYNIALDVQWEKVADLTEFGFSAFNRLAVSPKSDKLAVVAIK